MHTSPATTTGTMPKAGASAPAVDWYQRRDELMQGQAFCTRDGSIVMLDRRVPGDGTKWYVADRFRDVWLYEDSTIEPGDLLELLSAEAV